MGTIDRAVEFGEGLRRVRETRDVTLRDIADTTKIPLVTLEALERGEVARLPGGIFSRAIVRSYAQAVGTDPEAAVRDFLERFSNEGGVIASPDIYRPEFEPLSTRRWYLFVLAAVVLIPLAAIALWSLFAHAS